eukprot:CAMPEP_0169091440 /NCGR_PEP_ID=MMETSP1015-20121227/16363_1 /TAXON_ID=342587 /ORGANISM="Karlodinium micrum, Strain CCMP2283" /LENGTH=130 /DNA_ID=CAMNT_0009151931 /DNA_START=134 /DNA_END=526 /DNA_ORIENTATION=+
MEAIEDSMLPPAAPKLPQRHPRRRRREVEKDGNLSDATHSESGSYNSTSSDREMGSWSCIGLIDGDEISRMRFEDDAFASLLSTDSLPLPASQDLDVRSTLDSIEGEIAGVKHEEIEELEEDIFGCCIRR